MIVVIFIFWVIAIHVVDGCLVGRVGFQPALRPIRKGCYSGVAEHLHAYPCDMWILVWTRFEYQHSNTVSILSKYCDRRNPDIRRWILVWQQEERQFGGCDDNLNCYREDMNLSPPPGTQPWIAFCVPDRFFILASYSHDCLSVHTCCTIWTAIDYFQREDVLE